MRQEVPLSPDLACLLGQGLDRRVEDSPAERCAEVVCVPRCEKKFLRFESLDWCSRLVFFCCMIDVLASASGLRDFVHPLTETKRVEKSRKKEVLEPPNFMRACTCMLAEEDQGPSVAKKERRARRRDQSQLPRRGRTGRVVYCPRRLLLSNHAHSTQCGGGDVVSYV